MPYIVLDQTLAKAAPATTIGNPVQGQPGETLATLRTELMAQLLGRDDLTPTRSDRFINQGYTDLVTSLELPELNASLGITLDVDQPFYALPYVAMATENVSIVNTTNYASGGRPLSKIDKSKYRKLPLKSDEPDAFFREGGMIVLWPTPKTARTIALDFHIRPVWMTLDTHQPFLGVEWHEAILLASVWKALSGLKEYDKALIAKNEYQSYVAGRKDPVAAEDEGRVILSSVPRKRHHLISDLRGINPDAI